MIKINIALPQVVSEERGWILMWYPRTRSFFHINIEALRRIISAKKGWTWTGSTGSSS